MAPRSVSAPGQPCRCGQSPAAKLASEFGAPAAEVVVMGAPWSVSCGLGRGDVAGVGSAADCCGPSSKLQLCPLRGASPLPVGGAGLFPILCILGCCRGCVNLPPPPSLFPEVKHLKMPQPDQGFTLLQEPDEIPACSDGEEEDPVVRGAPNRGLHLRLLPQRMGRGEQCAGQCLPSPARTEKMLFNNKYLLLIH